MNYLATFSRFGLQFHISKHLQLYFLEMHDYKGMISSNKISKALAEHLIQKAGN